MRLKYFVGIDVSKYHLDISVLRATDLLLYRQIPNNRLDIMFFLIELARDHKIRGQNTLFCMEKMGVYNWELLHCLNRRKLLAWEQPALEIKRSLGITRGKNDRIDSERIALYAYRNQEKRVLWTPPRMVMEELRLLSSLRQRLKRCWVQLHLGLRENSPRAVSPVCKKTITRCTARLDALQEEIATVEQSMHALIQEDAALRHRYDILISVEGIGPIIARELIIVTDEFKKFPTAKKFACYAGIAPFAYTSGEKVTAKARVSHIANKKVKALLHVAAMASIIPQGEMKDYFNRKVSEGKSKMSVLNAIRNKIVRRIFACVQQNRLYEKSFQDKLLTEKL